MAPYVTTSQYHFLGRQAGHRVSNIDIHSGNDGGSESNARAFHGLACRDVEGSAGTFVDHAAHFYRTREQ